MYVQNNDVTLKINLTKTATPEAEDYFDLSISDPDGVVSYTEGTVGAGGWADTYVAPTATTDGYIEGVVSVPKTGIYTVILGTGGAANFTVLSTALIMVVSLDTLHENTITL